LFEPTGSQRDAASAIFNLPDYRVLSAVDEDDGVRRIEVETTAPPGCPQCGVLAQRVHSRRRQRLRDLPVAGPVQLVWVKRRWFCDQGRCPRGTFSEVPDQVPAYARSTARLAGALVTAVVVSGRAASEVAHAHRVSWWLVASLLTAAADLIGDPDDVLVRRLGVDEHRYRSVRFFRDEHGGWRRHEPWMTTLVDADTGRVLGVVDGRDSAGVGTWLQARSPAWRDAVQVVAIDPSAAFRKALREHLPHAAVSVDPFHLVKRANDMLTGVRQRVVREAKGRRGRGIDPAWTNRRLTHYSSTYTGYSNDVDSPCWSLRGRAPASTSARRTHLRTVSVDPMPSFCDRAHRPTPTHGRRGAGRPAVSRASAAPAALAGTVRGVLP
jgi:transposase